MAVHRVDRPSGQVYTEAEMAPALSLSRGVSWVHESPFPPRGWEGTNKHGSPSLKHSAMKCILSDQRVLTPQLFAGVPWHIASYLWDYLGKSNKRTLYMWKLFATAYPQQFPKVSSYRSMKIEGPKMPMRDYLSMLKSDSLRWRLVLTIASEFARVPELVEIAALKNLVALEIVSPPSGLPVWDDEDVPMTTLNDRVVRTWSELARPSGAFAHLYILRLYNQTDLTPVALRYMRNFPSLRFITVHNCPGLISSDYTSDGWELADIPVLLCPRKLYDCYTAATALTEESDRLSHDVPLLDFQIESSTHWAERRRIARSTHVCLRRSEESSIPESAAKKRKAEGDRTAGRSKKPVMRERKGDVDSMLAELL